MSSEQIRELEEEIYQLGQELDQLRLQSDNPVLLLETTAEDGRRRRKYCGLIRSHRLNST